jgi:HK97 gp10 family phage protein
MQFSVRGDAEISRKMEAAAKALTSGALERGLTKGAEVYHQGMKRRVRKRRRKLEKAFAVKTVGQSSERVAVGVILQDENAFYYKFLEKGHDIVIVTGKRLSAGHGKRSGRMVNATKVVGHVPAYPFIRPTYDEDKKEVRNAVQAEIYKVIDLR